MTDLEQWRRAILAHRTPEMYGEVRAILLYASHHPDTTSDAVWSISRQDLAETLNCQPAWVTRCLQRARSEGLLEIMTPGGPGVRAVYRGAIPAPTPIKWRRTKTVR